MNRACVLDVHKTSNCPYSALQRAKNRTYWYRNVWNK